MPVWIILSFNVQLCDIMSYVLHVVFMAVSAIMVIILPFCGSKMLQTAEINLVQVPLWV